MAKADKKSAKKASQTFHNIIKASLQPPPKAITPPEKTPKKKTKKKQNEKDNNDCAFILAYWCDIFNSCFISRLPGIHAD